jgi:hypothetical protein
MLGWGPLGTIKMFEWHSGGVLALMIDDFSLSHDDFRFLPPNMAGGEDIPQIKSNALYASRYLSGFSRTIDCM